MSRRKIKLPVGITLSIGMLRDDSPTAEDIRGYVLGAARESDDGNPPDNDVVKGLVNAYVAMCKAEACAEDVEVEFNLCDPAESEQVYRQYALKGYRQAVKKEYPEVMEQDDCSVYENCDWYEFVGIHWPDQLVAEFGFMAGYNSGRSALEMNRYYKAYKAEQAEKEV